MSENIIEWTGYAASAFVVGSFLMGNNITYLRIVNLIGATLFAFYGVMINKVPIIIPNVIIVLIQLYYLLKPKI